MNNIKVYSKEEQDGISELVKASSSLAYATRLRLCSSESEVYKAMAKKVTLDKAISQEKQEDLYYLDSVLVTSSWNKNDDVFTKGEVWAAKSSPENKHSISSTTNRKLLGT